MQFAGFALFALLHCVILITVRLARTSGGAKESFEFSPSASAAISDFVKLFVSISVYYFHVELKSDGIGKSLLERVSTLEATIYLGLAFTYAINNYMTFVLSTLADPGSIALSKSLAPICTALAQWMLFSKRINRQQWGAIIFMSAGVFLVQQDVTKGLPVLQLGIYSSLAFSLALTTLSSVVNADVVQRSKCPLALQNILLYTCGVGANTLLHHLTSTTPFFHGMLSPSAVTLIAANALMGLAVNVIYKSANALVKTMASCLAMAILVCISAMFFGAPLTPTRTLGSCVVIAANLAYFWAARPTTAAAAPPRTADAKDK